VDFHIGNGIHTEFGLARLERAEHLRLVRHLASGSDEGVVVRGFLVELGDIALTTGGSAIDFHLLDLVFTPWADAETQSVVARNSTTTSRHSE